MDEDEPYTRVVDQTKDGPEGCYETINAALLNIPAHSIIRVHEGVYNERIKLDRDVQLLCEGNVTIQVSSWS